MNWFLFALICLMVVIIILVVITILVYRKNKKLLQEWSVAKGQIVNIEKVRSWGYDGAMGDTGVLEGIIITVEYCVEGKTYKFKPSTFKSSDKIGKEYTVLYNRDNPSQARGYKGTRMAFWILLMLTLGLIILWIVYFSICKFGGAI